LAVMKRYKTVDAYLKGAGRWKTELERLRSILQSTELEETVKWGGPVYTFDGKNVVGIGGFKSYFGLWFFRGALLTDQKKMLVNAQEGRTKAMRQMRFDSGDEIDARLIKSYVKEAVGLVKRGVEIKPERRRGLTVPTELRDALRKRKKAAASFDKLTPGKRREYADFVASAKQAATKQRRIDKILPMIESGVGLSDRYRSG
jgi:uncharacterized protein YdeI (YjbR/CyaY-like superfamily)